MLRLLRLLLATGCVAGALAPAAHAGLYNVYGCRTPDGQPVATYDDSGTDGWFADAPNAAVGEYKDSCSNHGSIRIWVANNAPVGQTISGHFRSLDPNLVIRWATLWIATSSSTKDGLPRVYVSAPVQQYSLESKVIEWNAFHGVVFPDPMSLDNRMPVSSSFFSGPSDGLYINAECQSSPTGVCTGNGSQTPLTLWLHASRVVMADTAAPTVARVTGALTPDGTTITPHLAGTMTAMVQASDAGSGLRRVVVTVDGDDVATAPFPDPSGGRCVPLPDYGAPYDSPSLSYRFQQPCPPSGTASISWDTSGMRDGVHTVELLVEDASGTRTVALSGRATIDNSTTIGPGSPDVLRGEPNGRPASDTANLSVTWPATAKAPSSAPKVLRRCTNDAAFHRAHEDDCEGREAGTLLRDTWSNGRSAQFAGTLETPGGLPIVGAAINVATIAADRRAERREQPVVITDAQGHFRGTVPLTLGSLRAEFSWRARAHDTVTLASARASLLMTSDTTLTAPRKVRRGARITLSGRLVTRSGELSQVPITLQVLANGRWRTFSTATTAADGSWQRALKFAKVPGKYRVRAKVGRSPLYPFEPATGSSETVIAVR